MEVRRFRILSMIGIAVAFIGSGAADGSEVSTVATSGAPEIVVTATPIPTPAGQMGRAVDVVTAERIRTAGAASVPELLEQITSVSIQERGAPDVQGDLSIRGSSFQQVLVTLDGLPLVDPQTAHHNMDLPLPLSAVDRITVVPGPGSALFGPAAYGGLVDLGVEPPARSGLRFRTSAGSFETRRAEMTLSGVATGIAATASAMSAASAGFTDGTDYRIWSAWGSAFLRNRDAQCRISIGHADRDFGAQAFYAPYPSREVTSVDIIDLAPQVRLDSGWTLKGIARYRRHDDDFMLFRDEPDRFRNLHTTEILTERVSAVSPETALGTTAIGVQNEDAVLDSTKLGHHETATRAAFVQHRFSHRDWSVDLGLRADDHSDWGTEFSPSAGLTFQATPALCLRAGGGRAIRPPSFTELHYSDPANRGNADLVPEEAWGFEIGADAQVHRAVDISLTGFTRDTRDLIDWVRAATNVPWQASNIGATVFRGIEFTCRVRAGAGLRGRADVRWTDVDNESTGLQSKYALNVAEQDVALTFELPETRGFSAATSARYREIPSLNERYWLVQARAARRVGRVTLFVVGRNLLDEDYTEIPGVPTPGASWEAGLEADW